MFSYENNKHPGLCLFLSLVALSAYTFLFLEDNTRFTGFLTILWGSLCLLRYLSLHEAANRIAALLNKTSPSKIHNSQSGALAYDLTRRRHRLLGYHRAAYALKAFNKRNTIWFSLAALCSVLYIATSELPNSTTLLLPVLCKLFIVGAAFWCALSFAYSHRATQLMTIILTPLFLISLVFSSIEIPNAITLTSFNIVNLATTILFIYTLIALFSHKGISLRAFPKRIIILLLLFCFAVIPTAISENFAALLAGICLFAILWHRSDKTGKSTYIVYQCE